MSNLINKISSIRKNQEARTVASNFMWLSALQVAGYVFPLITMPYLARVIGVDGFGKIAFAAAIMVWIQTIVNWGFNLTAIRDVAQNRDDQERVSIIFSNILWARFFLAGITFVVLLALIAIIPAFRESWEIILISFLMIPGLIIFPEWYFQAMERMKYITILNVVTKLLFTLMVFIFVKEPSDYILQPLLMSLGYLISGGISLYIILGRWGIKLHRPQYGRIIETIKGSTDVFINHLAPNLYNSLSIILLGVFSGGIASGIYDGANKFMNLLNNILNTITRAFYPFLSRKQDKFSTYISIVISIAVCSSVAMYLLAPLLVNTLLSPEFHESITVLRILSISAIFYVVSEAYGLCNLIINHREKILRQLTLTCSIIGFTIAVPMVYYYSYIGVAVTVVVSRLLLGLSAMWAAKSDANDIYSLFKLRQTERS